MNEFIFNWNIVVYLLGLAATFGAIMWRIGELEKKVDKHNNLVERMYKVEARADDNKERLDKLENMVLQNNT